MFKYSESTEVNKQFKVKELLKTIKADSNVKKESENIESIKLSNVLSSETTNLDDSDDVKEIYIFDVVLKSNEVPFGFVSMLNKNIFFQTLFKFYYKNQVKYLVSIKKIDKETIEVMKIFENDWRDEEKFDFPQTLNLENVFKEIIAQVAQIEFKVNETFENYVERFTEIIKIKSDIEKIKKQMEREKQPNLKMELNDKIKLMRKQLTELEG